MMDRLELAALRRRSEADPPKRERNTFDFVVNGVSLFAATQASASDMCGCLSDARFEPDVASRLNAKAVNMLTLDVPAEVGHRAVLYGCPECGDLACGAITVLVSRDDNSIQWSEFAYENGFEPEIKLTDIGPFVFDWAAYLAAFSRVREP